MNIKNKKKTILKTILTLAILEGLYLFAIPCIVNKVVETSFINSIFEKRTNASISYENLKIKTHVLPIITIKADDFYILDKENKNEFLSLKKSQLTLNLLPFMKGKISLKSLISDNFYINVEKDKDGIFNFEKLFPKKENKIFSLSLKNSKINISDLNININDKELEKAVTLKTTPTQIIINSKKKEISIYVEGELISQNNEKSDFDINVKTKYPFTPKLNSNIIDGDIIIYNLDLDLLRPFFQKYLDKNLTKLSGLIDFIQLSAEKNNENKNQIILNTTFQNLIYDRAGWKNYIIANGINKINSNIELSENLIEINLFKFIADKVNIKADGTILLDKKPELDINIEAKNSRAENIASLLPPNLAPEHMIIQKVKHYGVYGDLDAKVKINGKVPKPDIIGFAKGRNVHILDKEMHKLHKGTVDLTFNKRTLNMDIKVDLPDGQKATVKGYTYMFREGINNVNIKTTDNIDFPLAQKIIIPVSKVFNFQLGPIPEMNITSGKGIIDLNIQGAIDYINLDGYSNFDDAELTYNGLHGKVKNGKGRLDFKGDVISFKSEKAFVGNNPLSVEGKVKINHNLDFSISSSAAEASDVLEIINNSTLLKDVKQGLAIITDASGLLRLFVNIKSKIVPVPYGHPPLPPEEAFEDMKVKGSVYMLGNKCKIEGFYTPIEKIKGIVDFTETVTDLHALEGISGTSPIKISGQIINDIETKVPDVDITITSKSVNLKDTIRFLSQSYMYPKEYPDLSCLYKISSKHDLYFTYKAKSVDFLTDKAYAEMNFIPDKTDSALKATSGKVIMDKATVFVDNVNAKLFDSNVKISGEVNKIDTLTPEYNLDIKTKNFNLSNLNNTSKLEILPPEIEKILKQFKNYSGFADIALGLNKNILEGKINVKNSYAEHIKTRVPFVLDDFVIHLNQNKVYINDLTAQIGDIPLYGNLTIGDLYTAQNFNGFFTSKITNTFIKNYLPSELSNKIETIGDINFSVDFNGNKNNCNVKPKLTFNVNSDIVYDGTNLGDINDVRELNGLINIKNNKIDIKKLDYIKYVSSHNNKTYPITFATLNGIFSKNSDNIIIPEEINLKTNNNIPARFLNIPLNRQILKQGSLNCDLKYILDKTSGIAKLLGNIECKNIDIPLFETVIKNVEIKGNKNDIDIKLFGFLSDSAIRVNSILNNNISNIPKVKSLNVYADRIDNNKLLKHLSETHNAIKTDKSMKEMDLSKLSIDDGTLEVKTITIKSLVANNFKSKFHIDDNGIFYVDKTQVDVGQGNIIGNISFDLNTTDLKGNFELSNVDANYVAETLFDGKNQIFGNANGKIILETKGLESTEIIKNLGGFVYFDISDGRMPKLGSLEYLLRASNIVKSGITGFTLNSVLELLNLVKTGYFESINGGCEIENGVAKNIEIFSKGENLSLYIHGNYDISKTEAQMEILGKLSKKISTIFGTIGNTSLNTFFKLIPGISMMDYSRKDFIKDVEKIPPFTNGNYDSRTFQAIIDGNINESGYVQSFKWVE